MKKVKYKVLQTTKDSFRVVKITYWFGIEWTGEIIGGEFFDVSSANSFIQLCTNNNIEIKLF